MDALEGITITTINEQVAAINTSISNLNDMDSALDGYINTLEATASDLQTKIDDVNTEIAKVKSELGGEITALEQSLLNELTTAREAIETELISINATLDELKSADAALDKKIAGLQAYVDSQLASTTNWANATFSTLTQYAETQTEISSIKASIEQINQSMTSLENSLTEKIAADIKAAIDELRAELSEDYVVKIENAVNAVIKAYTSAISSANEELTTAYTTAISTAIAESEAGMKVWVNEQLTQGYYDIATLNGMLNALSTRIDGTDADLQMQINEQKSALQTARTELTNAYKTAINEAITENNGVINKAIAEAVQNLDDKIQARLTVIDTHIANIQKQLTNLSDDIASIHEQIEAITTSISDLQDVDKEVDGVIDALEAELANLQEELESLKSADKQIQKQLEQEIADLKSLICALQVKDTELATQISALQTYINTGLQETSDWVEATFATLEQYSDIQTEISTIKALISKSKEDITDEYTVAIEIAISNSEASMKSWVNTQLAQGYYNIATLDGMLSALSTRLDESDADLKKQITEQTTALETAKTEITMAYNKAIENAINEYNGVISAKIASDIATATSTLQQQVDVINTLIDKIELRLTSLEINVEELINRIQGIEVIPSYSDGSVACHIGDNEFYFEVFPSGSASRLAAAGKDVFKLKSVYTQTKAMPTFEYLPISSVRAEGDILVVSASASELTITAEQSANAVLTVTSGVSSISTGYFPLNFGSDAGPVNLNLSDATPFSVSFICNVCELDGLSEYGICYGEDPLCRNVVKGTNMDSSGQYLISINALKSSSEYYFRAYAIINGLACYSDVVKATTYSLTECLITGDARNVSAVSAVIEGESLVNGTLGLSYGVCYSSSSVFPTIADLYKYSNNFEGGEFNVTINGLQPNTEYYYRVFAKTSTEISYGEVRTFQTLTVTQEDLYLGFVYDEETNPIEFVESFGLYNSEDDAKAGVNATSTIEGNIFRIELNTANPGYGTYVVTNIFKAALYFDLNGQQQNNKGGVYYAKYSNGELTLLKDNSTVSYHFGGDVVLLYNEATKTFTPKSSSMMAGLKDASGKYTYLGGYTAVEYIKKPSPYSYLFGTYDEEFDNYYGYPAKGVLTIKESNDPSYHLSMTFFGGTITECTVYANVSADGKKITTVEGSDTYGMGSFYASELNIEYLSTGASIYGELKFNWPERLDYTASKRN